MTSTSLPDSVLSHDMWLLQLNIEAAVRCSKERDPKLTAFYANTCASTWAAHRAFRLLAEVAPGIAATLVDELEEELGDGSYMEIADERAAEMGIDVAEFAEEIRASLTTEVEQIPAATCACGKVHPLLPETDCQAAEIAYMKELGGQVIRAEAQAVRDLEAEVEKLRAELAKAARSEDQLIGERDQAQEAADKLAYAIAPVEDIGEHSIDNDPWDNAHEELHRQRQELADTAMFRDFNQRSADHIATKRDLAEAAIAAWDRDEISGDAAVLMIRKALGDGPVPASPDAA